VKPAMARLRKATRLSSPNVLLRGKLQQGTNKKEVKELQACPT
jgi:hypothetical protein